VKTLFERWFGDGRAEALWEAVRGNPSLLDACRSPLIGSLACVVHRKLSAPAGTRRGDLYDRALQELIQLGWQRLRKGGDNWELGQRVLVLQQAAWRLFERHPEANDFGQREVEKALREAITELGYRLTVRVLMKEFLESGIMQDAGRERGEVRLAFLHRSFVEYLAGCALAEKAEREWARWKKVLDSKAWHPAWWEALVFMGWAMRNPGPLLELLADRKRDDYFRHRLVLALRVLAERG
jgi:hypothetical protein